MTGCATEKRYPESPGVKGNAAKIHLLGHSEVGATILKLRRIDEYEAWGDFISAYSVKPGTYDLYYQSVFVTNPSTGVCPNSAEICEKFDINWYLHPHKVVASLRNGYIYKPILLENSDGDQVVCLYGEPEGAPGQMTAGLGKFLKLSERAEKTFCGHVDTTVSYDSYN